MEPEQWAVVQLLGHVRMAGRISEVEFAGGKVGRLDIPLANDKWMTKLFGAGAIYDITFCDEATARAVAQAARTQPIYSYELPGPVDVGGDDSSSSNPNVLRRDGSHQDDIDYDDDDDDESRLDFEG